VKVLVTGCHGFLGHHVTALLLKAGHDVVGVDRINGARSPKGNRIAAFQKFGKHVRFVEGELHRWAFISKLTEEVAPDAIFHAAGQYSVKYNSDNDTAYIQSNLVAAYLVCWSLPRALKVPRIVYASSQAVSDARRPSGAYGATKGVAEDLLAAAHHRYGTDSIALRYGVLYGPMIRPDTDFYRVVNDHLAGREARPSSQYDKRTQMIEIADAAELALRAIECRTGGTHTIPAIAPDGAHTYRAVLHAAALATGKPCRDVAGGPPPHKPVPPDLSSVRKLLDWSPSITLPQGMERYLAWARTAIT
jgi:nucleoside-diphosphate-sugar epimerase